MATDILGTARDTALRASQRLAEQAQATGAQIGTAWQKHKPTTPLGWTTFVGLALLAAASISTALVAVSGVLVALCWVGIVAYSFMVTVSTVAAFLMGSATLFFAGACAISGFAVLSVAGYVYAAQIIYRRVKASATSYYDYFATAPAPAARRLPPAAPAAPAASRPPVAAPPAPVTPQPGDAPAAAPTAVAPAAPAPEAPAAPAAVEPAPAAADAAVAAEDATAMPAVAEAPAPAAAPEAAAPSPAVDHDSPRKASDQRGGKGGPNKGKRQHKQGGGVAAAAAAPVSSDTSSLTSSAAHEIVTA